MRLPLLLLPVCLLLLPAAVEAKDARIGNVRTLNDTDFDFHVPATLKEWQARRQTLREQTLVGLGLWPLPPRTPLNPVIHGKIARDGYTIEKVYFASLPGHYVTGNLYRPTGGGEGKMAGVLCPHGHWSNGRLHDAGEKQAKQLVEQGGEKTLAGARYFKQARCAQLARMGCVVFHYDMVGSADSKAIAHRAGFTDAEAALRLQNFMGLQTWNSIRALDFLVSLPEVDPARIGVTGASGGGTQTFILGAIDDRPAVAFPAVMVSTRMQGGCICENCEYLRQGTGNVELAGLFAPKPLALSGADDWTVHIETKGLPELKALYRLYGAEDKVAARAWPKYKHNYNQVSREFMYGWFNKHLRLGQPAPVEEKPFTPVPPAELSVYDGDHPRPKDEVGAKRLRQYLTEVSDRQLAALKPGGDAKALAEYREVLGTALRVMAHDELPAREEVEEVRPGILSRKGMGEEIPYAWRQPEDFNGTVVVWIHPEGRASLDPEDPLAKQLLAGKAAILAVDVFGTGALAAGAKRAVDGRYCGYTFGYNRPLVAERIHDILTAVAFARGKKGTKQIHLVGSGSAGPWAALARGLCGDAVSRTAVDLDGFRFERVKALDDPMMLPGALKYGGLGALMALGAPGELFAHHTKGTGVEGWLGPVYRAAGVRGNLRVAGEQASPGEVAGWLLR